MLILRRLIGIIILILLCVVVTNAQSQRATPSGREKSKPQQQEVKTKQQQPASDQRGTEQSPLIVKTVNPPKTEAETNQERQERSKKASHDWWFLVFTALLAVFALIQVGVLIWQGYSMEGTLQLTREATAVAKESADATKESVETLKSAERANLFVMVQHAEDAPHVKWFCDFIVFNAGRTPAILTNVNGSYERVAHGDAIPNISPEGDHGITPDTMIIAGSPGIEDTKTFRARKSQAFRGDYRLVCIGRIQYKDIFGASRETGFCWEYMDDIREFQPINDPKRNYHT